MELLYKNDVANLTLGYLGSNYEIVDLDNEQSTPAKIIRRSYNSHLKDWLEKHEWSFATEWAALSEVGTDDRSGYQYVYNYPSDCLTVRQIAPEGCFRRTNTYDEYNIEFEEVLRGQAMKLLTNLPDAWAEYTIRLNVDDGMPSHFAKGLAAYIAMEEASSIITQNFTKVMRGLDLERRLNKIMGESMSIDLGRTPPKKDPPSPFIQARTRS